MQRVLWWGGACALTSGVLAIAACTVTSTTTQNGAPDAGGQDAAPPVDGPQPDAGGVLDGGGDSPADTGATGGLSGKLLFESPFGEGGVGYALFTVVLGGPASPVQITMPDVTGLQTDSGGSFSADGSQIAFVRYDGLTGATHMLLQPTSGGTAREVSLCEQGSTDSCAYGKLAPDGNVYYVLNTVAKLSSTQVAPASGTDGGVGSNWAGDATGCDYGDFRLSQDGTKIVVVAEDVSQGGTCAKPGIRIASATSSGSFGDPLPLTDVQMGGFQSAYVELSKDGSRVFFAATDGKLHSAKVDGTDEKTLITMPTAGNGYEPGKYVVVNDAYLVTSDAGDGDVPTGIYAYPLDGGARITILAGVAATGFAWTP